MDNTGISKTTETEKRLKSDNRYASAIGVGLALVPLHNVWLADLVKVNGESVIFLPAIGTVIWILATLLYVRDNWHRLDWGDRKLYIPLLVLTTMIGISGFVNAEGLVDKIAPLLMGASLFAIYVVARTLKRNLFRMLIPFIAIGAIIALVQGLRNPGVFAADPRVAGLITNYCAYTGFLIFGAVVNPGKWQWILGGVVLVGVFFIGALEALFIVGVLGIAILARRDFDRRLLIIVLVVVLIIGAWLTLGHLFSLYTGNRNLETLWNMLTGSQSVGAESLLLVTSGRWPVIVAAVQDIRLFGHGLSLSTAEGGIVHNIPLIIVHQVGVVGALAWVFTTTYCAIKTKWKYAWIAIIAMGVFDHYIWTQFTPFWWVLVGVSTTSPTASDLIFKGDKRRRQEGDKREHDLLATEG